MRVDATGHPPALIGVWEARSDRPNGYPIAETVSLHPTGNG